MALPLAAVLTLLATSAQAANQCGPRRDVLDRLADKYEERPVAIGLSHNGRLLEVLAAQDGRTWTVIATTPEGTSCILDAGEEWHAQQAKALGPDA